MIMYIKKTITALSFLLASLLVSAQYNTLSEWYIGFSGGKTVSTLTLVPKLVDKVFALNNDAGFTIRYISEEHFGLQAEANYFQSGWKEDLSGTGLTYSYERKLNLVQVPLLLHAFAGSKNTRYFLNIGPQLGFLIGESENIIDNSKVFEQHGKSVENNFQYGIVAGAGLEFHLWKTVLGVEGRYCYQFSNIFNDEIGSYFNTSSIQAISINAHLLFRLK